MKTIYFTSAMVAAFVLSACGGGSSDSNRGEVTLNGTVPGTLIEAFCDDNSYSKVHSVENGTAEHPFSIKLPKSVPCRVYMTMNENDPTNKLTTPIVFKQGGKVARAIKLEKDIDIGHVPLPAASTSSNDANSDHIKDSPLEVEIENEHAEVVDDGGSNPFDRDHNGEIDGFEDKNHDGTLDGYEDHDNDGRSDIDNDSDHNGIPDGYEHGGNDRDDSRDRDGKDDDRNKYHDRDGSDDGRNHGSRDRE